MSPMGNAQMEGEIKASCNTKRKKAQGISGTCGPAHRRAQCQGPENMSSSE